MTREADVGALVVDAEGGVGWWSSQVPAVAGVSLELGPGVLVEVDIAWPERALSWTVAPGASPEQLGVAFDDSVLADLVDQLRAGGESVSPFEGRTLSTVWARRALVAAVSRWTLYPIDGGALILDTAVAENGIGNPAAAAQLIRFAEYSLIDFAADSGRELSTAAARSILEAVTVAGSLDAITDPAELTDTLAERSTIDDDSLFAALTSWRATATEQFAGVIDQSGGSPETDAEYGPLDVAVVPPRIVAWNGAREHELRLTQTDDGFVMSTALAVGADPLCKEAGELLAYLADGVTGDLLAVTPAAVDGNSIVARFPTVDADLFQVRFGLFDANIDPNDLRLDRVGAALIDVDRLMLEAWNSDREAVVELHSVSPDSGAEALQRARAGYQARLTVAETATNNAQSKLDRLIARQESGEPVRGLLVKRRDAIARYRAYLADPARGYADPILAELVPPVDAWQ